MSSTITVINRTSDTIWIGIDPYGINTNPPTGQSAGTLANGQLDRGATRTFTVNGTEPFKVGAATVYKGYPSGQLSTSIRCFMVTNVFSGAIVTIATSDAAATEGT